MSKKLKNKKLLVCDENKCLMEIKRMYPTGSLILESGESGVCYVCGKKYENCNQVFVESFFDIKRELRGD